MMNIIKAIFGLVGLLAFVWSMIGTIPGIILGILTLTTKDQVKKKNYAKWTKISLGGLILLVAVFVLYSLLGFLGVFLGFSMNQPLNLLSK